MIFAPCFYRLGTHGHVVVDLKASLVSSTPRTKSDQSGRGSRIYDMGEKVRIGTLFDKTTRGQMSGSGHILATERSGSGRFEEEKGPDPS